jgi:hypothetical protein
MGYLDPGLFGILSQIGVAILLVAVSAFALFSKSIKKFFAKIFKKEAPVSEDKLIPLELKSQLKTNEIKEPAATKRKKPNLKKKVKSKS